MCTQSNTNSRKIMSFRTYSIPPKKKNSQKSSFQKKSKNPFRCKSASKHISYKTRIASPVRPKSKSLDQSSSHSNRKCKSKNFYPEFGHFFIFEAFCLQI